MPAYRTVLLHGFSPLLTWLRIPSSISHGLIIPHGPREIIARGGFILMHRNQKPIQSHAGSRTKAARIVAFSRRVRALSQKRAQHAALKRGYDTSKKSRAYRRIGQYGCLFSSDYPGRDARKPASQPIPSGIVPPEPRRHAVQPLPVLSETIQAACLRTSYRNNRGSQWHLRVIAAPARLGNPWQLGCRPGRQHTNRHSVAIRSWFPGPAGSLAMSLAWFQNRPPGNPREPGYQARQRWLACPIQPRKGWR